MASKTKSSMDKLKSENLSQKNADRIDDLETKFAFVLEILKINTDEKDILSEEILELKQKVQELEKRL